MVRIYHMDISRLNDKKHLNTELTISAFTMRSKGCDGVLCERYLENDCLHCKQCRGMESEPFSTAHFPKKGKNECIDFSDASLELSEN